MKTNWKVRQLNNYKNRFWSIRKDSDRLNFLIDVYNNTMIQRGEQIDALIIDLLLYFVGTPVEELSGRFLFFIGEQEYLNKQDLFIK